MNPEIVDEEFLNSDLDSEEERKENVIYNQIKVDDEEPKDKKVEEFGELGLDMFEEGDKIVIQAMIAGVCPEDIDIKINRDKIKIRGIRRVVRQVPDDDYHHKELYWGGFVREIKLPHEVDSETAEAIEDHGLLELRLPRLDRQESQSLKVKTL